MNVHQHFARYDGILKEAESTALVFNTIWATKYIFYVMRNT